jgi:DNA polymerase III epsilon subunit-like protein
MIDLTGCRYAVVDVEGNGQQPPDLVELAVAPIVGGNVGDPSSWLLRPASKIAYMATKVHGITNQDVADAPDFAAVESEVRDALAVDVLVAHAAHVDVGVLRSKLTDWQPPTVLDTLKLARRLMPGRPSYRLGALVADLNLDADLAPNLKPHRATYDALVTARLFVHLATSAGTVEALQGQEAPSLF